MSDNLIQYVTGSAGGTIATDEVAIAGSTVHVQRIKMLDGTDGGTVGWTIGASGVAHVWVSNTAGTVVGAVAHDAADSGSPIKVGGRADSTQQADVADGDRVDALFNLGGMQVVSQGSVVAGMGKTITSGIVSLSATGTVVAAVASQKIKVFAEHVTVQGGTMTVTVRNGASGATVVGPRQFAAPMGVAWCNGVDSPLFETGAGSALTYVIDGTGTIGGVIRYYTEA